MGGSCNVSLAAIRTVKIGQIVSAISPQINSISTMEIVLGRNWLPIQNYNRPVDVSGCWDESQGSVECPTILGAVAYDHPVSGKTYILIYHQVIHCKHLLHIT